VYYRGEKIKGASVNSFKVRGKGYAEDNWNTYYRGHKMK
ncbi:MAG: DKNYY domain-containing protein, partial [Duncaniella sp.]